MMLLATVALSFAACTETPDDGKKPTPEPEPTELTFEVEVGEVTHSAVSFTVTPSDLEADYLVVLYGAEEVEEFTKDEYLVAALMQELEAEARTTGKTLLEFMPEIVDKGVLTDKYERLAPETEYYLVVFGVDAAKEYALCSKVVKEKVTTLAAPKIECSFEIDITVDGNYAEYKVTPSNEEAIWYFYTVPAATYEYYKSEEGYQMDDAQFILYCLQYQIEQLRGAGYTDNEILNALFHKGELTLQAEGLEANTEYTAIVAAFDVTETGEISLYSDVTTKNYTTGDAKAKSFTFDIQVTDVEMNRAAILITPTDLTETFCWLVSKWDGVQTAEEVMNGIIASYGAWMGMMANYTGVQDYTGGPNSPYKYKVDAADTDYYVIAFGYAGGVTTEPVMVTFHTLPAPAADTTEFTMTGSNPTPYGFDLSLTASHETTYYTLGICLEEEYDEAAMIAEADAGFDELLEMSKMWDPNVTPSSVLSTYYYSGNISSTVSGMNPETTVMGYVFAIDSKTGHIVKAHTFNPLATTTKLGSVQPSIELVGYYSGDEENGSVFGQPDATKGKAITVVKYTNFDGARSLFSTMLGGNLTNPAADGCSDPALWGTAAQYWRAVSTAQPYSFYVAEWDYEQTALAYAVDQEGIPGALGRLYTMPTAENKGNIDDLKALVAELNAASGKSSFVLPESLVIGESGIVISDIKVERREEVAPAAQAEVVRPALNNKVMVGNYIRPFYL